MKVVVSEFMDPSALKEFGVDTEVVYDAGLVDDRPGLLAALADATGIIVRNRTQVNAKLLDAAPLLKVVGRLGVGLDNIDLEECTARGVAVCPATGANTLSVAEYVISTILILVRGSYVSNAAMISGNWPRSELIGSEVSGRTLGLIGYGEIAQAVARRARSLGMNIAANDPFLPATDPAWKGVERLSRTNLMVRADMVSLHVPLTNETRNMVDEKSISSMKPGAILINTARGGIVDEAALARALISGALGGAALDVFETEPLTAENGAKFADVPNLILTPHIAGLTKEGNARVSIVTVANVAREMANAWAQSLP